MARPVTDQDVRDIIPNTKLTDLTPYITPANLLVDKLAASDCGSGLSDELLEQIEIYLAAHFAAVSDPSLAILEEKVEGASIKAARGNPNENGILSTHFGQMANTLSCGCLVEIDKRNPTVGFF